MRYVINADGPANNYDAYLGRAVDPATRDNNLKNARVLCQQILAQFANSGR
jgi:hypothetical protein